jgi:two-component system CitB family sensor kinase
VPRFTQRRVQRPAKRLSDRFSLRRLTLTRQLLVLQLLLVVVVLCVVGAVGYAQTTAEYRNDAGNRAQALAETFATDRLVRTGLSTSPYDKGILAGAATRTQAVSGASYVVVASPAGDVLAAQDPTVLGDGWGLSDEVRQGRGWTGPSRSFDGDAIESQVPVLDDDDANLLGYVVVGLESPGPLAVLRSGIDNLLLYLALASGLGVVGSVLLSRRIKKQTLGLEPRDIAGLVEHREALLHGIREGVIGLDNRRQVTLVNDEAADLLALPADAVGRPVTDLDLDEAILRTLLDPAPVTDLVLSTGSRLVSISQMPVTARGTVIGTVTTLRDRTQMAGMQRELDVTRRTADSLRAQAHEFTNRLHTIAGLIHIKQPERAIEYINGLNATQKRVIASVTHRIADTTLAALLIAKISVAQEAGVSLTLAPDSRLDEVDPAVAADLETIIGNFLDNAIEAVQRAPVRPGATVRAQPDSASPLQPSVELLVQQTDDRIEVRVRDSGPGIDLGVLEDVFSRGITTKDVDRANHGIGLSLAQLVCQRRGGGVSARNEGGAVFAAWFPHRAPSSTRDQNEQNKQ